MYSTTYNLKMGNNVDTFHLSSVMSRMATGYDLDGSPAPVYDWGWEGPAAQMYSTSDDLNKVCM